MVTHFEPSYKVIKICSDENIISAFKDSYVPLKNDPVAFHKENVPVTTNVEFSSTNDEFNFVEYDFLKKKTPRKSIEQLKDTKHLRSYILTTASIISYNSFFLFHLLSLFQSVLY